MNVESRLHALCVAGVLSLCSLATPARSVAQETNARPFSQAAIGVSVGTQGIGGEAATPLLRSLNLRGGADIIHASASFTSSGINYSGNLALQSGQLSLDWFPFHGSFRLSPGVMFYNGSNVNAGLAVPANQHFTVNSVTYYSSATSPLTGNATATWPKAGPRITFGFGNMLPRRVGRHFAWTSEFGMAYFGTGTVTLGFSGSACTQQNAPATCFQANTNSTFQANVAAEQAKIQKNMVYARFYPIIRTGLSYRF